MAIKYRLHLKAYLFFLKSNTIDVTPTSIRFDTSSDSRQVPSSSSYFKFLFWVLTNVKPILKITTEIQTKSVHFKQWNLISKIDFRLKNVCIPKHRWQKDLFQRIRDWLLAFRRQSIQTTILWNVSENRPVIFWLMEIRQTLKLTDIDWTTFDLIKLHLPLILNDEFWHRPIRARLLNRRWCLQTKWLILIYRLLDYDTFWQYTFQHEFNNYSVYLFIFNQNIT